MSRLELRRWQAALLLIGVASAGAAVGMRALSAFDWIEHRTLQVRFAIRGEKPATRDVVVVALDDASVRRVGRYPAPRTSQAKVVDALRRAGARVIALDLALEQPTDDRDADLALAQALRRAGAAVVSVTRVGKGGQVELLVGRVPFDARVRPGHTLAPTDSDGAIRRFPRFHLGVPTFAVVAAALQSPRTTIADPPPRALIDYAGQAGTIAELSFEDVLDERFASAAVRRKVVVVGPTTFVAGDYHPTTVGGPVMSGPEILANAIATAIDGYPLQQSSAGVIALLLLAVAVAVAVLLCRRAAGAQLGAPSVAVAGTVVFSAWTVASQVAFQAGTVVDYSAGVFAVLVATATTAVAVSLSGRRERVELRKLFAAHSPSVVRRVLAQNADDPARLARSEIIAGYTIMGVIGQGGMGVVYRAVDVRLRREVALKLIRPQYALQPVFRARFERESRTAALIGHPNIVPVYAAGEDDGLLYIAMMLVDGIDLARRIATLGPLEHTPLVTVLREIASGLDAAHARGLVHRDVKPANILLTRDPLHAFLTDFGIAKQLRAEEDPTLTTTWIGTVDYLAPEVADGAQASSMSDIYALAGVLYFCISGSVPFDLANDAAKLRAHAEAPPPSVSATAPGTSADINAVIARGMAKQPADRYPSAGDLAEAAARALTARVDGSVRQQLPAHMHDADAPTE